MLSHLIFHLFLHILGIGAMAEVTSIVAIVKDHLETMK